MKIEINAGKVSWTAGGFIFGPGGPSLTLDGRVETLRFVGVRGAVRKRVATWRSARGELEQILAQETTGRVRVTSVLRNLASQPVALNHATLFTCARLTLGLESAGVRIFEQNAYMGRVRTPRQMATGSDRLKALDD